MNEELFAKYPPDLCQEVVDRLPLRSDSTLGRAQRRVIGPVPTSRETYDPSHVLQFAPDGDRILVLDSHDLREDWNEDDLSILINSLRKRRNDTGATESEGSGTDIGSQVLNIIFLFSFGIEQLYKGLRVT